MSVAEILEKWQLPELCTIFEENGINMEAFQCLTFDVIKKIIPKIGSRFLFMKRYKEYLAESSSDGNTCSISGGSTTTTDRDSIPSPTNFMEISDDISPSCNPWPDAIVGLTEEEIENIPAQKERRKIQKKAEKTLGLHTLFMDCSIGKGILSHYKKCNTLTDNMRDKIVEIVLQEELHRNINQRFSIERFTLLSNAIVGLFPTEMKEVYFSLGYKRKIGGGHNKVGYGKLYRKFYFLRSQMRQSDLLDGKSSTASTSTTLF